MLRNIIKEIRDISLCSHSFEHRLIGLKAIDQILLEMTYKVKKLNPSLNRRISVGFRENELKIIYENNLQTAHHLVDYLKNSKILDQ